MAVNLRGLHACGVCKQVWALLQRVLGVTKSHQYSYRFHKAFDR